MVAANADGGGQMHSVPVVDHEFGGLGADIDHGDAFAAVLRQNGGVARGEGLENRLLHGQVGRVDGANDGVVLLYGGGDQVNVDLQARGKHLAWVAVPGVAIDHEILRKELQDHAVFHELNAGSALYDAPHVGLPHLLHVAKFQHATAVGAAYGGAAHADHYRLQRPRGGAIGIAE